MNTIGSKMLVIEQSNAKYKWTFEPRYEMATGSAYSPRHLVPAGKLRYNTNYNITCTGKQSIFLSDLFYCLHTMYIIVLHFFQFIIVFTCIHYSCAETVICLWGQDVRFNGPVVKIIY